MWELKGDDWFRSAALNQPDAPPDQPQVHRHIQGLDQDQGQGQAFPLPQRGPVSGLFQAAWTGALPAPTLPTPRTPPADSVAGNGDGELVAGDDALEEDDRPTVQVRIEDINTDTLTMRPWQLRPHAPTRPTSQPAVATGDGTGDGHTPPAMIRRATEALDRADRFVSSGGYVVNASDRQAPDAPDAPQSHAPTPAQSTPIRLPMRETLRARRREDEIEQARSVGRVWRTWPADTWESLLHAPQWRQAAIAPGEVDPIRLAYGNAIRYVQASHANLLDRRDIPTTIFAIFYYGLGLTLHPLSYDEVTQEGTLAVYHRRTAEVYLDWSLFTPPDGASQRHPLATLTRDLRTGALRMGQQNEVGTGSGTGSSRMEQWAQAIRRAPLARLALAWACAQHLIAPHDGPIRLGFSPQTPNPYDGANNDGHAGLYGERPSEVVEREDQTLVALAGLYAPYERLVRQLAARHITPDALSRWTANRRQSQVAYLATINNCPPLFVEASLAGAWRLPVWNEWEQRLRQQLPALDRRWRDMDRRFAVQAHARRLAHQQQQHAAADAFAAQQHPLRRLPMLSPQIGPLTTLVI